LGGLKEEKLEKRGGKRKKKISKKNGIHLWGVGGRSLNPRKKKNRANAKG